MSYHWDAVEILNTSGSGEPMQRLAEIMHWQKLVEHIIYHNYMPWRNSLIGLA
uniref:Uncharacterized protein n=1 Tax=Manihot esculenta TaxID=3983 RepID=A0A199UAH2_MANES